MGFKINKDFNGNNHVPVIYNDNLKELKVGKRYLVIYGETPYINYIPGIVQISTWSAVSPCEIKILEKIGDMYKYQRLGGFTFWKSIEDICHNCRLTELED